jgi:conjugative relaxase-like TrwC/TraI family protein
MLRVTESKNAEAAKQYFGKAMVRSDYYIDGQEIAGAWGGKAAERLGLLGQVTQQDYFALVDNLHPETGEQLTPRQKDNRRAGYDFTFSTPKSVSVFYEMSGDERILTSFRDAVKETMEEIEREMKTRVRKGGTNENRLTGNMAWAEFVHFTSRPVDGKPDPHLHAHCFAPNLTWDDREQRWKAGQFGEIKRDAPYFEAAFDARLAKKLNDLGYATRKAEYSFELAGVPESIIDKFSRRRNEIEAEAEAKGIETPEGKHAIGYYGRENKTKGVDKGELRQEWNKRLSDDERVALRAVMDGSNGGGDGPVSPAQAMNFAVEHSFERASVIADKRLRAEALRFGVGSVLPDDVAGIAKREGMIAKESDGQLLATTADTLRGEVAMLQFARDGQRKFAPLMDASSMPADALSGLSQEQKNAAMHILTSRDTVTGIVGRAGTGKTRMMRATVDAIHSETDKKVFTFAPSSQASRGVLASEGFKDATTLETLLKNEKLQAQVNGQIIWVDEAGLVSNRDMRRLMDVAKREGSRVILSGDYSQHGSVQAGDAFRLLEQEAGVRLARLTQVRRQTEPGYRKAVEAIAEGSGRAAQKGFDALDQMGCVIEAGPEERHALLVGDYLKAVDEGKTGLIIAPTHAEGGRLTDTLRGELKERGLLGQEREFKVRKSTGWTQAQKGDIRKYEAGMIVEFQQNAKGFTKGDKAVVMKGENGPLLLKQDGTKAAVPVATADRFEVYRAKDIAIAKGDRIRVTRNGEAKLEGQAKGTRLNNGDIVTVEGFDKEGNIRIGNGKVLPKGFGHFSFGYVDTSYASQGKTVDRVFIATGDESLRAANQQQWYVSASRGREVAKIYVDDKQAVRDAIARTGQRLSAVEFTQTRVRKSSGARVLKTLLDHQRFTRFVKTRAAAIADYWRERTREKGNLHRA